MTYTFNDFRAELDDIKDEGLVHSSDILRMLDAVEQTVKEA